MDECRNAAKCNSRRARGVGIVTDAAVYSIAAGLPFLDTLVDGIRARYGSTPFGLSETVVLLPTRRACRALRDAFLRRTDGEALLLPRIQPLGDLDHDETAAEAIFAADAGDWFALPTAIDPTRRRLALARLILAKTTAETPLSPSHALALAEALGRLFDEIATEKADLKSLINLVPADFAVHWQVTIDFLAVVTHDWPLELEGLGLIDPIDRRNRLIEARAARWRESPPLTPVIAAGSTGSIPATAMLLATIARLPQGAVVLPGLDAALDDEAWGALEPSHPQYGLKQLIERIEIERGAVKPWVEVKIPVDRGSIFRAAMLPAAVVGMPVAINAETFAGLRWIEGSGPQEEATAIAVLLREAVELPGQTAALVTPDRRLARRVATELKRWNIEIDDSAGTPLGATPPGVFFRLIADVIASEAAPVPLLALLKHPLAAGGFATVAFRSNVRALEREALRGARPAPGFAGIAKALGAETPHHIFIRRIGDAFASLTALAAAPRVLLGDLLRAHIETAEWLAATDVAGGAERLWSGDTGAAAADFFADALTAANAFPPFAGSAYAGVFEALLNGRTVRPSHGLHPRLFIWGPLEARLQCADLFVLGGLNEGTWPPALAADPWLSRPMRAKLGLTPTERRIGQSAHDFAQTASAPRVVLSRATKVDGVPTVPARWLSRLAAVAKAGAVDWGRSFQSDVQSWAQALDTPARIEPTPPPAPRPPVKARPKKLSVTRIETWLRDPYAIYARYVLGLKRLDPIDANPGGAERGIVIHRALDRFLAAARAMPEGATVDRLLAIGIEVFAEQRVPPAVAGFWWPRFERIAYWFIENERTRSKRSKLAASEAMGSLRISSPAGAFELTAKADRIDRMADGSLEIIDYKTGTVPSQKEVSSGRSLQLPLEALIAEAGGFAGVDKALVTTLAYWRLTGADPPGEEKIIAADLRELFAATRNALDHLIAAYARPETAFHALPRPHPKIVPRLNDYDHLARVEEWSDLAPEDVV
ncbi:MAG: double-strand break repair protein AddB [Alphaproteobacteria bacterium]|nr:double-strand break repair protein AddB [Alphaproteobacteria bacterium]